MSRRGKEFPDTVKDSAIRKWHKENPGRSKEKLEVDHVIPIHVGNRLGIPSALLKSRANAEAKTQKEHKEKHRNELSDEEYKTLAQALLGWIGNLFS